MFTIVLKCFSSVFESFLDACFKYFIVVSGYFKKIDQVLPIRCA
jgi:hypothetical protein